MAIWHIVVLYLAIFALLQFVVYRYLRGDDGQPARFGSASNPDSGMVEDHRREAASPTEAYQSVDDDGVQVCAQCGARNDADGMYTYCRNCTAALGRA